jgi:addiction module HigA family antidote
MPRSLIKLSPIHPGDLLREEFWRPLGMTQYRLAKGISVPPRRINEIVRGPRGITADTALRLARFFGTTERFWMNFQMRAPETVPISPRSPLEWNADANQGRPAVTGEARSYGDPRGGGV